MPAGRKGLAGRLFPFIRKPGKPSRLLCSFPLERLLRSIRTGIFNV
ncbi:hypothetical protein B4135_0479 [Caldibacillus debilis]|uniref:Uncharacterized protein n=1 Tax=Caldibacillus debilis TaxID=301148 RepID=A0A150L907_9BACI|nr:hypothetical protein B4135_0479 [Caldibacillus debilis]